MAFQRKWKNSTGTKTYFAWRSMRSRCYNRSNPSFRHYGARGITVCQQWLDNYDQFVADMGQAPEGRSLDRVNNALGYSPENCRWATMKEQLNNQRRNRRLTLGAVTKTASEWSEDLGLSPSTLGKRLARMSAEKALQAGRLREWRHGTRAGYEDHKCKCQLCRDANNKRHRERRSRMKSAHNEAVTI